MNNILNFFHFYFFFINIVIYILENFLIITNLLVIIEWGVKLILSQTKKH